MKYPIPEIPDDSGKKSGTDWVLPKIIGSGRVSGTRQALIALFTNQCTCSVFTVCKVTYNQTLLVELDWSLLLNNDDGNDVDDNDDDDDNDEDHDDNDDGDVGANLYNKTLIPRPSISKMSDYRGVTKSCTNIY